MVVEWVPSAVPAPVGSPVSPTKEWIPEAHRGNSTLIEIPFLHVSVN